MIIRLSKLIDAVAALLRVVPPTGPPTYVSVRALITVAGFLVLTATLPTSVTAGTAERVTIQALQFRDTLSGFVFIRLSAAPIGSPACATDPEWHFVTPVNNTDGQAINQTLSTAFAGGLPVTIQGTNLCDAGFPPVEVESVSVLTVERQ